MPQGTLHWPKLTNQCEHSPVHPDSLVAQETGPVRIKRYQLHKSIDRNPVS